MENFNVIVTIKGESKKIFKNAKEDVEVVRFSSKVYLSFTVPQAIPTGMVVSGGAQQAQLTLNTFFLVAFPDTGEFVWVPSAVCQVLE